jgi:ribosomal subunit interface protein
MQVLVSSKNFSVTEAIQQFADKQVPKLLKVNSKIIKIRLFLESNEKKTNDPHANQARVVVEVPGKDISVSERSVDMYEAVVKAFRSAARHVRKEEEKRQTKHRSADKGVRMEMLML